MTLLLLAAYAAAIGLFLGIARVSLTQRIAVGWVAPALAGVALGGAAWSALAMGAMISPTGALGEWARCLTWVAAFVTLCFMLMLSRALMSPLWRPTRAWVTGVGTWLSLVGFVAVSNPWLHLLYGTGGETHWDWPTGPLYWPLIAISYVGVVISWALTTIATFTGPRVLRRRRIGLALGSVAPFIANAVGVLLVRTTLSDVTPIAFAVAAVVVVPGALRGDYFAIATIARSVVLECVVDPVIAVSGAGRLLDANPSGLHVLRAMTARDDLTVGDQLDVTGANAWVVEDGTVIVELDGESHHLVGQVSDLRDRGGAVVGSVWIGRDMTESVERAQGLERVNERLRETVRTVELLRRSLMDLATRDGLTGLHNRRHLVEGLDALVASRRGFGLLMIDVDRFKTINDTWGHAAGDAVLIEMARRLLLTSPDDALVARWGGEEFVVAVPGMGMDELRDLAISLVESCARGSFDHRIRPWTVSVGVASHPVHGDTEHALVAEADASLYAVKRDGGNGVGWRAGTDGDVHVDHPTTM